MSTYLVLGSEGQIGAPLVTFLKKQNHEVLEFDILNEPSQDLRIENNELLNKYIEKSDFIFFLAFDVGGSRYLEQNQNRNWFIMNNMKLMTNTFDSIGSHSKPFLFASSQMADMKHSTYGGLKFIGERITMSMGGIVTRFWNVYGPEKDLEKAHVITDFILKATNEGKIEMLTNGQETRQFLHADDCSRALYTISKDPSIFAGKSLDVTNFEWTTIAQVATIISSLCGDVPVIPGSKEDAVQKLVDIPPNEYILRFWKPLLSLEEGIRDIISSMEGTYGKIL